jgi:hypothetical protein
MSPADPVRADFPDAAAAVRPLGLFAAERLLCH